MDSALLLSALLMGVAGSAHCVVMCGASSAALVGACGSAGGSGRGWSWSAFHLGRLLSYALAGALVSSSVGAMRDLSAWAPFLRPFWALTHLAALGFGLFLVWQGRQPVWFDRGIRVSAAPKAANGGWQRMRGPGRALGAGGLWALWPCGLLQSALLLAALANSALAGAMVMAVFALASSMALGGMPMLWARVAGLSGLAGVFGAQRGVAGTAAIRLSGLVLAGASAWALGHGLWTKILAYCSSL